MSWVKLHTDILSDPKLMKISRNFRKKTHITLLPWLIVYAKLLDAEGQFVLNDEPVDPQDIARMIPETTPLHVQKCMDALLECGILIQDERGVCAFPAWSKRNDQKPSDDTAAVRERVRRHRAALKARAETPSTDVTPRNALHVTPCNAPEKKREEKKRVRREKNPPNPPSESGPSDAKFAQFSKTDCDTLYEAWGALGRPNYGRFRNAFGPLFGEAPKYPVAHLVAAITAAIDDARHDANAGNGFALRTLTPEKFIERVQYWVDATRPIAERDAALTHKLGIVS